MMRRLLRFSIIPLVSLSSVDAQPATPAQSVLLPQAIYSPQPVYRSEWAKQGLTGKGVVLVTIDPKTGMVTGTRMLQSTGNKLLDGAAWRHIQNGASSLAACRKSRCRLNLRAAQDRNHPSKSRSSRQFSTSY
jgi:Periplasmic protein TonB, links inner and outer membranes